MPVAGWGGYAVPPSPLCGREKAVDHFGSGVYPHRHYDATIIVVFVAPDARFGNVIIDDHTQANKGGAGAPRLDAGNAGGHGSGRLDRPEAA